MALIRPFRAVRPTPASAFHVAAVPYDVVDTEEARSLAAGNPLSFLHVSRAEIDLPPGTDPHADVVYRSAADRYRSLKSEAPLLQEAEPSLYVYLLEREGHQQAGVAASYSLAEYDSDVIKKHERTRKDKEDDRTRHIAELRAQTGPVFLAHRPAEAVADLVRRVCAESSPLIDFVASDGVRHALWRADAAAEADLARAFAGVSALYIADGHHRAASAARARQNFPDSDEAPYFLAVAFPSDQLRILPYHRVVRDLNGMSATRFVSELSRHVTVAPGPDRPARKGEVSMYVAGKWYVLDLDAGRSPTRLLDSLDGNLLHERVLGPILGVGDVRTDRRIDFIGGARGTRALEQRVNSGTMAVAFSMYPVSMDDLMRVSDAGEIMPPKSTWFEPKLRDGLLIHEI
jgi:uncharacterized protein (DUF1015 family)